MPISKDRRALYPANWRAISERIRFERAGNACEFCGAENHEPHPETGSRVVLTVAHHPDPTPSNVNESNLHALCQACHLRLDAQHHAENARRTRDLKRARESGQLSMFGVAL